ncbi:MAG: HD domain-containing protein [Candidatus Eremiobacteraeota bacterium]|nr:HD domain-containing protein [Candidatus Eremiobacteraeota bacterium]
MRTIEPIIVLAIRDALACFSESPSIPYLPHPMEVCRLVLACGGSQLSACAAVLHDVVALGKLHPSAVEQRYGSTVLERVQVLSRQRADDEEGLLLLCADRLSHLLQWGPMAPQENLVRERNALQVSLRRLDPTARQILSQRLDSVQAEPVVHRVKPKRTRLRNAGSARRSIQQHVS